MYIYLHILVICSYPLKRKSHRDTHIIPILHNSNRHSVLGGWGEGGGAHITPHLGWCSHTTSLGAVITYHLTWGGAHLSPHLGWCSHITFLLQICAQKRDSAVTEQPKGKKVPDPSEQPTGRKVSPDPAPSEHDSQPKVTKYERRTSAPIQQPPRVTPPPPPSQPTPEAKHTGNDQDNGQPAKGSSEPEKAVAPEQGIRAKLMMYENKSQAAEKQNHSSRNPTTQPLSEKLDPPKGAAAPKPQQQASLPAKVKPSQIAPVDLIMTDFAERKENDDFWFSDPFYTHQSGYKLCLKVIPGGLGVGASKHVSVSVYVMKGEFDDSLKWPFKGDITLQLLDWAKEEVRSEKVISFHDKVDLDVSGRVRKEGRAEYGWGNPEFVSHAELASGRAKKIEYLRNDSLKFRVSKIVIYSK